MKLGFLQKAALAPLVIAPLAVGGVHLETLAALQVITALVTIGCLVQGPDWTYTLPRSVAWFAGALLVLGLIQLVPLPPSVLSVVSPMSHEWQAFLWAPPPGTSDPHAPTWFPASLAPVEGWLALGRQAFYLLYFVLCSHLFTADDRHRPLLVVAALGAFEFVLALAHTVTGAEGILWVYELRDAAPRPFMSTFVNANFQAAFYGVTGLVALGLSRSRRVLPRHRAVLVAAALGSFVGVYLTLSRSGMVMLPVALVLWFGLARRAGGRPRGAGLLVAGLGVLSLGIALYVAASDIGNELVSLTPWSEVDGPTKLDIWPRAADILRDFWRAGPGVGAFPFAFAHYGGDLAAHAWFPAPENLVLQALSDYGLPGGLVVLALGGWVLLAALRLGRGSASGAGVIAALAFAAVHELFDFALSAPGVMLVVVILTATLVAWGSNGQGAGRPAAGYRLGRAQVGALAVVTLLGGSLSWARRDDTTHHSRQRLRGLTGADTSPAEFEREFDSQRRMRPADSQLYWLRAEHLRRQPAPRQAAAKGIHYINRALFLDPAHAPSHYLAGEFLRLAGYGRQAGGEYRLAASYAVAGPQLERFIEQRVERGASVRELVTTAGDDRRTQGRVLRLVRKHRGPQRATEVMRQMGLLDHADADAAAALIAATAFWASGDWDELHPHVQRMVGAHPRTPRVWYWALLSADKRGDRPLALSHARRARSLEPDTDLLDTLLQSESGLLRRLDDLDGLNRLLGRRPRSARVMSEIHRNIGLTHRQRGNLDEALANLKIASSFRPSSPDPHMNIAAIFADLGRWRLALRSYDRVLALVPDHKWALVGKQKAELALAAP